MSGTSHQVILYDGPAAGRIVSVPCGLGVYRVHEQQCLPLSVSLDKPPIVSTVKVLSYLIAPVQMNGQRYFVGVQGPTSPIQDVADMIEQSTLKPCPYC